MTAQPDMDAVVSQTVQQLGAENALLRLELAATRAALQAAQPAEDAGDKPEEG